MLNYLISGVIFGVLTMLGFGFENYLMAKSSRKIGPFKTVFWYQAGTLMILIILSVFLFNYSGILGISHGVILLELAAAFTSITALLSFNKGLQVGNAALVAPIASATALVTTILSLIFLHEPITSFQLVCVGAIILGTVLVSYNHKKVTESARERNIAGIKYALVTLIFWGVYFFLNAILVKDIGWFSAIFLTMIPVVLILMVITAVKKESIRLRKGDVKVLVFATVLGTIGILAFNFGVTYSYVGIVAPIGLSAPLILVFLAMFLLKEKVTTHQKIGIVLIIAGIVLLAA